jgi:ribulose-phosphate 3-epimerase
MIDKPNDYIKHFAEAGADNITFHYEAMTNVRETVDLIHRTGKKAGISVRPETPVSVLLSYLEIADMFLIMTVEPGFGGQPFNTKSTERIRFLSDEMKRRGVNVPIEVDGGINAATAPEVTAAGATVLVAGSYIFGADNMEEAVKLLRC